MSHQNHIEKRLAALPPKVATPFRRLLAVGQLNEDTLAMVLDAGELAGDSSRLIAFAAGYLHLRGEGVPVDDVIRMARQQRRRIRLDWCAKRWQHEHDRLSRAEVLARLAAENVTYDVSEFETLLPERFDGYLIRTSRRLGMEGLRQRHCVASYHFQICDGRCAIASVFINRQRWTVELLTTGNPDAPLQIGQIRTRYNGLPSRSAHDYIHAMLGIDSGCDQAAPEAQLPEPGRSYMDTLRRLFPVLVAHGVQQVTVSFDGCGDNGSIQDICYDAPDGFDAAAITIEHVRANSDFEDGQWIRTIELIQSTVPDAIEELVYDYLEETGVDWCNNDGGYGELVIDARDGTVSLDIDIRYTHSANEFSSLRYIATGEER